MPDDRLLPLLVEVEDTRSLSLGPSAPTAALVDIDIKVVMLVSAAPPVKWTPLSNEGPALERVDGVWLDVSFGSYVNGVVLVEEEGDVGIYGSTPAIDVSGPDGAIVFEEVTEAPSNEDNLAETVDALDPPKELDDDDEPCGVEVESFEESYAEVVESDEDVTNDEDLHGELESRG